MWGQLFRCAEDLTHGPLKRELEQLITENFESEVNSVMRMNSDIYPVTKNFESEVNLVVTRIDGHISNNSSNNSKHSARSDFGNN